MHAHQIYSCVLAVVLVTSTGAAPLQEKQAKEKKDVTVSEPQKVQDQEAELENLVSLAGEKANGNNVAVHESHVSHYENKNGKEIKTEQTEEKVTDTESGKVLADVKQVTETGSDENGEPQKVTETKVDIPDKGVHETFIKNDADDSDEPSAPGVPSVEFSPTAMAQYLLNSFDFDNFYAALKDLVSSSIMSEEEAERYEAQVIAEYQRLVAEQNALAGNYMPDDNLQGYYPAYEEPEMKRSNMPPMADQIPDNLYGLDRAYENYLADDIDLGRQGLMENSLSGDGESLTSVIDALLNAWWEKDFEGGNARAMALVSYLDDVVSRDDNPDDIGQIRDILADMLANALLDDVQNAENEYKMEQAVDEAVSENQENAITDNSEAESDEEEEEESKEDPEEELKEVAKVDEDTAEEKEKPETESNDSEEESEEESEEGEKAEKEKSLEEKH